MRTSHWEASQAIWSEKSYSTQSSRSNDFRLISARPSRELGCLKQRGAASGGGLSLASGLPDDCRPVYKSNSSALHNWPEKRVIRQLIVVIAAFITDRPSWKASEILAENSFSLRLSNRSTSRKRWASWSWASGCEEQLARGCSPLIVSSEQKPKWPNATVCSMRSRRTDKN